MVSTHDFYRIDENPPGAWMLTWRGATTIRGYSGYPTPAHAVADVLQHNSHADFEVHVRADDMTSPVEVRCALLKLREAGYDQARRPYELTADQYTRIGLTDHDVKALTVACPFFGTSAARVLEREADGKIALELAIMVLGDLPGPAIR